jgi:hypothetical protein
MVTVSMAAIAKVAVCFAFVSVTIAASEVRQVVILVT